MCLDKKNRWRLALRGKRDVQSIRLSAVVLLERSYTSGEAHAGGRFVRG